MVLGVETFVAPDHEPLTLEEVKHQLRLTDLDEAEEQAFIDADLGKKITAAREKCESYTGQRLITQTVDVWFDTPDGLGIFDLPVGPVQSVVSIAFKDIDLIEALVDVDDYSLDFQTIYFSQIPPSSYRGGYRVRLVCGYGDTEDVPVLLIEGMKELIAHWYLNRAGEATGAKYEIDARTSGDIPQQVASKWRTKKRVVG